MIGPPNFPVVFSFLRRWAGNAKWQINQAAVAHALARYVETPTHRELERADLLITAAACASANARIDRTQALKAFLANYDVAAFDDTATQTNPEHGA